MPELPTTHPLSAAYVDLDHMTVILNSGDVIPITKLLDWEGDECDPEDAVVAIACSRRSWWRVPIHLVRQEELN